MFEVYAGLMKNSCMKKGLDTNLDHRDIKVLFLEYNKSKIYNIFFWMEAWMQNKNKALHPPSLSNPRLNII